MKRFKTKKNKSKFFCFILFGNFCKLILQMTIFQFIEQIIEKLEKII